MRCVPVNAPSGRYQVKIGSGLLPSVGKEVRACTKATRCAVVAGGNVFPLYGETVLDSLRSAGLEAMPLIIPAGEQSKCLQQYGELLTFLAENRFTRSDCVVALGGGVNAVEHLLDHERVLDRGDRGPLLVEAGEEVADLLYFLFFFVFERICP